MEHGQFEETLRQIEAAFGREHIWQHVREFLDRNKFNFPIVCGIIPADDVAEAYSPQGERVTLVKCNPSPETLDDIASFFCERHLMYSCLATSYLARKKSVLQASEDIAPKDSEDIGFLIEEQEQILVDLLEEHAPQRFQDECIAIGIMASRRCASAFIRSTGSILPWGCNWPERLDAQGISVCILEGVAAAQAAALALAMDLPNEGTLRLMHWMCLFAFQIGKIEEIAVAPDVPRPPAGTAEGLGNAMRRGWNKQEAIDYLRQLPFLEGQKWIDDDEAQRNHINMHRYSSQVACEQLARGLVVSALSPRGFRDCARKRSYKSKQQALREAARAERRIHRPMHVYHCPMCGGWHLTSMSGCWDEHDRKNRRLFKATMREHGIPSYAAAYTAVAEFIVENWREIMGGEDGIDARWQKEFGNECHHKTSPSKKGYALAA